jgi:hypothetical protein
MTKKNTKRASADVGFMMTAYNLRRIINILGLEPFRKFFEGRIALFISSMGVKMHILTFKLLFEEKLAYWKARLILPANRLPLIHLTATYGCVFRQTAVRAHNSRNPRANFYSLSLHYIQ